MATDDKTTARPARTAPARRRRGFEHAAQLVAGHVRNIGEARGFAVSRLLTHWEEIAGAETAEISVPVSVRYRPGSIAATLTLLTTGAFAPILQSRLETIRERVNACYGYNAIERIRITQTAGTGFAEGRVAFRHKPAAEKAPQEPPRLPDEMKRPLADITDPKLRAALESLGRNILSRQQNRTDAS